MASPEKERKAWESEYRSSLNKKVARVLSVIGIILGIIFFVSYLYLFLTSNYAPIFGSGLFSFWFIWYLGPMFICVTIILASLAVFFSARD